jgi:hypothetical protein
MVSERPEPKPASRRSPELVGGITKHAGQQTWSFAMPDNIDPFPPRSTWHKPTDLSAPEYRYGMS